MMRELLDAATVREAVGELDGWVERDGALHRTFEFADFNAAFGWMTRVALVAEQLEHHPDWSNVYSTVRVRLSTHDVGGITEMDLDMARRMSALYDGRVTGR